MPLRHQRLGVVEEEQAEIEQRAGDRLAVDQEVLLVQVPAARAHQQRRDLVVQLVVLCLPDWSKVMVPRTASRRLTWPSRLLFQVGELESSKSAMKTLAPELSALMIILRSTGPVISTRRSSRSAGMGATVHSLLADGCGLGQKIGQCAGVDLLLADLAARQKFLAARFERDRELCTETRRLRA